MKRERPPIRVGTRGSLLAKTQTDWIVSRLQAHHQNIEFQTIIIETTGDRQANVPYAAVGTKGMFVKEIEHALIDNTIDVGVHSLKDMPGTLPHGLVIGCVPEREDAMDAFLSRCAASLDDLPSGSRVGTSSARRRAQISAYRNDLQIAELRGNVDTRLKKLSEGEYDAIILACAGLHRLGRSQLITSRLSKQVCLPAVGQGALALETRANDKNTNEVIAAVNDKDTADCVRAERALLNALGGGCSVPIAAYAELTSDYLQLLALVATHDGSTVIRATASGHRSQAEHIGIEAAVKLRAQDADALLAEQSLEPVADLEGK